MVSPVLTTTAYSQNKQSEVLYETDNNIRVEFKVFIDDKPVEMDNYHFEMTNKINHVTSKINTTNEFTVFVRYDQEYTFRIGHKDYCTKVIELSTIAPTKKWVLDWKIYLYSNQTNQPDKYEGRIAYNDVTERFQHYKQ